MIHISINADTARLDELYKHAADYMRRPVSQASNALIDDIRSHWNPTSPAPVDGPPGQQTTNLDHSFFKDATGRDILGRFANAENALSLFVRVDASRGPEYHGRGSYEGYVENGTSKNGGPRPYFFPAVERMKAIYPEFFVNVFNYGYNVEGDEGDES